MLDSLGSGDRAHLHELYARSVMLLELGRVEQWVELFAPAAQFRVRRGEGIDYQVKGRAELLTLARQMVGGRFDIALGAIESFTRCRHHVTNLCLFNDGLHGVSGYAHILVMSVGATAPRW